MWINSRKSVESSGTSDNDKKFRLSFFYLLFFFGKELFLLSVTAMTGVWLFSISFFFSFFFQRSATNTRKKLKLMLFLLNVSKGNCKAIVFIIKAFWPSSYSGESWKWKSHCLPQTFRCQKINNSTTSLNLEGKRRKGERRTKKDRGYDTDFEIQLSAPLFET